MLSIPQILLEQIERGNVLLFIGDHLDRDTNRGSVFERLAAALAERCGVPAEPPPAFPEVAQMYEDSHGRAALVQFVRQQFEESGNELWEAHQYIAELTTCRILVTTGIDRRLERAFAGQSQPLDVVVGDSDMVADVAPIQPAGAIVQNPAAERARRQALRRLLITYFDESDLRDLCFDLHIEYADLSGHNRKDKVRELIGYCERYGRIDELVGVCRRLRPHSAWLGDADSTLLATEPDDESRRRLYKLLGSIERDQPLILTVEDYEVFFENQNGVPIILQGHLAHKTLLLVGCDLGDSYFQRLYRKVIAALDNPNQHVYALVEQAQPAGVWAWCKRRHIKVIEAGATSFLAALVQHLAAKVSPTFEAHAVVQPEAKPAKALPDLPYKLLDFYEAKDAAIFFGRQREIQRVSALIHAHRLVLLFGASGVGKTSLLLAGAVPRLEQSHLPYAAIYTRVIEDPVAVIRRTLRQRLPDGALPETSMLVDALSVAIKALGRPLVIILDQFEEFFIRLSPQFRTAFITELEALYNTRDLPVKIVISLREDWLAAMSEIERRIPEISRVRMRLLPLTRAQAREAITAPAARLGVNYEAALIERLLDDLVGAVAGVMPPQLQLVCSALYDALGPDERRITLTIYERLGGARGVLQQYLTDELARLGRDVRVLARRILEELVTSQGTKAVKTDNDLALAMETPPATLAPLLEKLVQARLLRALEHEDGSLAYELAHEYLIREIGPEPESQARKQAEELIQQEIENWRRFGTLLAADKLALVEQVREELRLSADAEELLLRSAFQAGHETNYWLQRVTDSSRRTVILAEAAGSKQALIRRHAVEVLGTQDVPESVELLLALALRDADQAVRASAQTSLAKLTAQRPQIVARLEAELVRKERGARPAALRAMAKLPFRELPSHVRVPVLATRVRERVTSLAHQSITTPVRRAVVLTAGLLLMVVALVFVISANSYYVDTRPAFITGQPNEIVIRRGLPILPGFGREEVSTGIPVSQIFPDRWDVVQGKHVWGLWMLRGNRDYQKWGNDVAVTLYLRNGVPMLWYLNHDEGLKALIQATGSQDIDTRRWSADALGQLITAYPELANTHILETLRILLQDSDPQIRVSVAAVLGRAAIQPEVADKQLAPALLPLLADPESNVRAVVIAGLGEVAGQSEVVAEQLMPALLPLLKDPSSRYDALRVLERSIGQSETLDEQLVTALLPLLSDPEDDMRWTVTMALGEAVGRSRVVDRQLVPALLPLLTDPDLEVRSGALRVLGKAAGQSEVVDKQLAPALQSLFMDSGTRADVLAGLGEVVEQSGIVNEQFVPVLLPLLTNPSVRPIVVTVLGEAAGQSEVAAKQVVPALLPLLKDSDPNVRADVAAVLGEVARQSKVVGKQVVPALLPLLEDADMDVRVEVAAALGAAGQFEVVDERFVPTLLPLLKDSNVNVRINIAAALGGVAGQSEVMAKQVVPALLPLLEDADMDVRAEVAAVLGRAAGQSEVMAKQVVPALLPLLKASGFNVRHHAAVALVKAARHSEVVDVQMLTALLSLLKEIDSSIRAEVIALVEVAEQSEVVTEQMVAALVPLLTDPDPNIHANVMEFVEVAKQSEVVTKRIVAALLPLLTDPDPKVRVRAAIVLEEVAEQPEVVTERIVAAVLPLLTDPDPKVRADVIVALGNAARQSETAAGQVIPVLLPLLTSSDPNVRADAAVALGEAAKNPKVAVDQLVPIMLPLLMDSDSNVRPKMADSLTQIYIHQLLERPDEIPVDLQVALSNPRNVLVRSVSARSIFLVALRYPDRRQALREHLETIVHSEEPIARIWANKTLIMLDIANLAHRAATLKGQEQKMVVNKLSCFLSDVFFGEDTTWAAQKAVDWLAQQNPVEK